MLTCRVVIERAYRKLGVVDASEGPTIVELDTGLETLQGLYEAFVAAGMFGRVGDADYPSDGALGGSTTRLRAESLSPLTITITDSLGLDGSRPGNRAAVTVVDAVQRESATVIYDPASGGWLQLSDLLLDTPAPLSNLGDGLSSCLAESLAEARGMSVSPLTQRAAGRFRTSLSLGLDGARQSSPAEYF